MADTLKVALAGAVEEAKEMKVANNTVAFQVSVAH
jgi:hypothetical protein